MEKPERQPPRAPQPGPPPEVQTGRPVENVERDWGDEAWDRHAKPEEPPDRGRPTTELTGESVDPPEHDDPSDSG